MRKTAHYRRAAQVMGNASPLQESLDACRDQYPAVAYPIYRFVNGVDAIIATHDVMRGVDFCHLVTFEQGAGAAVIETLLRNGVNEEPAPRAKQYIQSQIYFLCRGNDIVFTSHNAPLRDTSVGTLINKLVAHFNEDNPPPSYALSATLDENRFLELMNDGIQEIDLDVGGYRPTLEYLANQGQVADAGLFSVLKPFITDDVTEEDRSAAEKIMARLTLRPGRNWSDINVKELLTEMAKDLVVDGYEDGFAIVTKSGLRITRDSVRVKDDFHVDGNRRVVDIGQIRNGLSESFEKFENMGVFER